MKKQVREPCRNGRVIAENESDMRFTAVVRVSPEPWFLKQADHQ